MAGANTYHLNICIRMYVFMYICVCVCVLIYINIYLYICMHIKSLPSPAPRRLFAVGRTQIRRRRTYKYVYIYIYRYLNVCVYIYIYMYIYIYSIIHLACFAQAVCRWPEPHTSAEDNRRRILHHFHRRVIFDILCLYLPLCLCLLDSFCEGLPSAEDNRRRG